MKWAILLVGALALAGGVANAQTYGTYSANPMAGNRVNPYAVQGGANLYDQQGNFAGNTSNNSLDPNSVNNPLGRYGSSLSPDSVNNQLGRYGSSLSPDSPSNPLGQGLTVCGPAGCN